MTNNDELLSTTNWNIQDSSGDDHQSLINEDESPQKSLENDQKKSFSLYLNPSVDNNQNIQLRNIQDPLFYEQPLHFHYGRYSPSLIRSQYGTGDQVQSVADMKLNKYEKMQCLSSYHNRKSKSQLIHRQQSTQKKNNRKGIKPNKQKKKCSMKIINKTKGKNKRLKNSSGKYRYKV